MMTADYVVPRYSELEQHPCHNPQTSLWEAHRLPLLSALHARSYASVYSVHLGGDTCNLVQIYSLLGL